MSLVEFDEDLPVDGNIFEENVQPVVENSETTTDSTPLYNLTSTFKNNAIHFSLETYLLAEESEIAKFYEHKIGISEMAK